MSKAQAQAEIAAMAKAMMERKDERSEALRATAAELKARLEVARTHCKMWA